MTCQNACPGCKCETTNGAITEFSVAVPATSGFPTGNEAAPAPPESQADQALACETPRIQRHQQQLTKIEPGNEMHLSLLMAPHSLNLVTGEDRERLLAWGRDVWRAAQEAAGADISNAQPAGELTPEIEADLRTKINPAYVGCRGTESWERAMLLGEIDRLRAIVTAPRGTDAQILKERELTASAIQGAMAFGYQGAEQPPAGHWLEPFYRLGERAAAQEEALYAAHASIAEDRQSLRDCHAGPDGTVSDALGSPALAKYDALLAQIDAALAPKDPA